MLSTEIKFTSRATTVWENSSSALESTTWLFSTSSSLTNMGWGKESPRPFRCPTV